MISTLSFNYWGKAVFVNDGGAPSSEFHLLPFHCLDVAACSKVLLERNPKLLSRLASLIGMEERILFQLLIYFAAIHDIGKFSPAFQSLRPEIASRLGCKEDCAYWHQRHDVIGQAYWSAFVEKTPEHPLHRVITRNAVQHLARAAFGHHGCPPKQREDGAAALPIRGANFFPPQAKSAAQEFESDMFERFLLQVSPPTFGSSDDEDEKESKFAVASWWIAGFFCSGGLAWFQRKIFSK